MRPFIKNDHETLHRLWTEPEVRRYLWDDVIIPPTQTTEILVENQRLFKEEGFGLWAIRQRDDPTLVGFCGYWRFHNLPRPELLYGLSRQFWGRGLAVEAASAMISFGFDRLGFDVVTASTDPPNTASIRVLERLDMDFDRRETKSGQDTVFYKKVRPN